MTRRSSKPPTVRPVDRAIKADRPEKQTIRTLWVEKAREYDEQYPEDEELLYLTLSGAEGRDIEQLATNCLIQLTEVGGIAEESQNRIAAVEKDSQAVLALQKRFPGLKIYNAPFQNLLRGEGLLRFPEGDDERLCRARIVNLDLDATLNTKTSDGEIVFPILIWVKKLGQMHANAPRRDWCLCLTLHGEVHWTLEVSGAIQRFLAENFELPSDLRSSSRLLMGDELYESILGENTVDFSGVGRQEQQKLLMIFVPKKIAELVRDQGWKILTRNNLRYGRTGLAPMVTWVLEFIWEKGAANTPAALHRQNLDQILMSAGYVNEKGQINPYA